MSFFPSVINLWSSLDYKTRYTRTFDTFKINLKRKVVLSKIPGKFLVWDRRSNNLYTRLCRNYSSLKYYLFRSNTITYLRCVCGFIREDASHFLLKFLLYSEQCSLIFYTTIIFEEKLELYYLETQRDQAEICCYQKQYGHSLTTVGVSLKEHTPSPPPPPPHKKNPNNILLICHH